MAVRELEQYGGRESFPFTDVTFSARRNQFSSHTQRQTLAFTFSWAPAVPALCVRLDLLLPRAGSGERWDLSERRNCLLRTYEVWRDPTRPERGVSARPPQARVDFGP